MMQAKAHSIRWAPAIAAAALLAACGGGQTTGTAGGTGQNSRGTGTATLSWAAPIENSDGSAVTNLAGYRIYHGTSADSLDQVVQVASPGITMYVFDNLSVGTHYFAITAYNTSGVESDRSAVGSKAIL